MEKITYQCETCGSEDVLRGAWVAWDVDQQEWTVDGSFQKTHCNDCGGEASIEAVPLAMED